MSAFFAMDGYAWFVWPSWICAIVALIGLYLWSVRQLKERETALKAARERSRG